MKFAFWSFFWPRGHGRRGRGRVPKAAYLAIGAGSGCGVRVREGSRSREGAAEKRVQRESRGDFVADEKAMEPVNLASHPQAHRTAETAPVHFLASFDSPLLPFAAAFICSSTSLFSFFPSPHTYLLCTSTLQRNVMYLFQNYTPADIWFFPRNHKVKSNKLISADFFFIKYCIKSN